MNIRSAFLSVVTSLLVASASQAALYITAQEIDNNVVITALGTLDTSALDDWGPVLGISPGASDTQLGFGDGPVNVYGGPIDYSGSGFGAFEFIYADSYAGDIFGVVIVGDPYYFVTPVGYESGSLLSSSITFFDTTLAEMGFNTGVHLLSWGSGDNADYINISIVPEPSTYALFFGLGVLGLTLWRKRLRKA